MARKGPPVSQPWILPTVQTYLGSRVPDAELVGHTARVIHMLLKAREVHLFDGAHVLRAFLTRDAVARLDEDPDDLGIVTNNLLGHLVAVSGVTVLPDTYASPPALAAAIEKVRPFCNKEQRPSGRLMFVHLDPAVQRRLKDRYRAMVAQFSRPVFRASGDSSCEEPKLKSRSPPKNILSDLHDFRRYIPTDVSDLEVLAAPSLFASPYARCSDENRLVRANVLQPYQSECQPLFSGILREPVKRETNELRRVETPMNGSPSDVSSDSDSQVRVLTVDDIAKEGSGADNDLPRAPFDDIEAHEPSNGDKSCLLTSAKRGDVATQNSLEPRRRDCDLPEFRSETSKATTQVPNLTRPSDSDVFEVPDGTMLDDNNNKPATQGISTPCRKGMDSLSTDKDSRSDERIRTTDLLSQVENPEPKTSSSMNPEKVNDQSMNDETVAPSFLKNGFEAACSLGNQTIENAQDEGSDSFCDDEGEDYGSYRLPDTQHLLAQRDVSSPTEGRNDGQCSLAASGSSEGRESESSNIVRSGNNDIISATPSVRDIHGSQVVSPQLQSVTRHAHDNSSRMGKKRRMRLNDNSSIMQKHIRLDGLLDDRTDLCSANFEEAGPTPSVRSDEHNPIERVPKSINVNPSRFVANFDEKKLNVHSQDDVVFTDGRRSSAHQNSARKTSSGASPAQESPPQHPQSSDVELGKASKSSCVIGEGRLSRDEDTLQDPGFMLMLERAQSFMNRFSRLQYAQSKNAWQVFLAPKSLIKLPSDSLDSGKSELNIVKNFSEQNYQNGRINDKDVSDSDEDMSSSSESLAENVDALTQSQMTFNAGGGFTIASHKRRKNQPRRIPEVPFYVNDDAVRTSDKGKMSCAKQELHKTLASTEKPVVAKVGNEGLAMACVENSMPKGFDLNGHWLEELGKSEDELRYHFMPEGNGELSAKEISEVGEMAKLVVESFIARL